MKVEYVEKLKEYEARKARTKALQLRLTCTICGAKPRTLLNCPCGTTQYCSTDCQRVDWRERGHRKACKEIRCARAAEATRAEAPSLPSYGPAPRSHADEVRARIAAEHEAARAEAPTPPPSPPKEIFYGPAPRSHADEVRARIAAEHEAARARREAQPERAPVSERFGARCPICFEDWDVNCPGTSLMTCCCQRICTSCYHQLGTCEPCGLCGAPWPKNARECLGRLLRHVENDVPEAVHKLGDWYLYGRLGLKKSGKKAVRLYQRASDAGMVDAMLDLGRLYDSGNGDERPVRLDKTKALELFRKAADTGSAKGQYHIALCLMGAPEYPETDEEKKKESFRFMKLSADQGMVAAQMLLARMYLIGFAVDTDLVEARRLCELAAARAPDNFGEEIRGWDDGVRDLREEIAAEMSARDDH